MSSADTNQLHQLINEINKRNNSQNVPEDAELNELINTISKEIKQKDEDKTKKNKYIKHIKYYGMKLIPFVLIYVLLSQNCVKGFFASYISQINANIDGQVPFRGIVTYGLIFGIIYLVSNYYIEKKFGVDNIINPTSW